VPWKETKPVLERMEVLVDLRSGLYSLSVLAERYGVSRKTLYKWRRRFELEGEEALQERDGRRAAQCRRRRSWRRPWWPAGGSTRGGEQGRF